MSSPRLVGLPNRVQHPYLWRYTKASFSSHRFHRALAHSTFICHFIFQPIPSPASTALRTQDTAPRWLVDTVFPRWIFSDDLNGVAAPLPHQLWYPVFEGSPEPSSVVERKTAAEEVNERKKRNETERNGSGLPQPTYPRPRYNTTITFFKFWIEIASSAGNEHNAEELWIILSITTLTLVLEIDENAIGAEKKRRWPSHSLASGSPLSNITTGVLLASATSSSGNTPWLKNCQSEVAIASAGVLLFPSPSSLEHRHKAIKRRYQISRWPCSRARVEIGGISSTANTLTTNNTRLRSAAPLGIH